MRDDQVDRRTFYEHAMQKDFPDSMDFELKTTDPESTFSMEGFESIAQQIKNFLMARTYAHDMANHMRIRVDLAFNESGVWTKRVVDLGVTGIPWFEIAADPGMDTIDGAARLRGLDTSEG